MSARHEPPGGSRELGTLETDQYLLIMQQQAQSSSTSTDLTTLAEQANGLLA
jgi:hypothetical protein